MLLMIKMISPLIMISMRTQITTGYQTMISDTKEILYKNI